MPSESSAFDSEGPEQEQIRVHRNRDRGTKEQRNRIRNSWVFGSVLGQDQLWIIRCIFDKSKYLQEKRTGLHLAPHDMPASNLALCLALAGLATSSAFAPSAGSFLRPLRPPHAVSDLQWSWRL